MRLNNKGFAITSIIYGILILFSLVMVALLGILTSRNARKEKLLSQTISKNNNYVYSANVTLNNNDSYTAPYTGKYMFTTDSNQKCSMYLKKNDVVSISASKINRNNSPLTLCNISTVSSIKINKIISSEEHNLDKSGANVPELLNGLIPIRFDATGNTFVADVGNTDNDNMWYNYDNNDWANAGTINMKTRFTNLANNNYHININDNSPALDINLGHLYFNEEYVDSGYKTTEATVEAETYIIKFSISQKFNENDYPYIIGNKESDPSSPSPNPDGSRIWYSSSEEKIYYNIDSENLSKNVIINVKLTTDNIYTIIAFFNNSGMYIKLYGNNTSFEANNSINTSYKKPENCIYIGSDPGVNKDERYANIKLYDVYYLTEAIGEKEISDYYNKGYLSSNDGVAFHYNFEKNKPVGMPISKSVFDTMYTWIPRFKYKIWEDTDKDDDGKCGVGCESFSNLGNDGLIDLQFEKNITTSSTTTSVGSYYTHPAFKDSKEKDLTGFWAGKYETGDIDNVLYIKQKSSTVGMNRKSWSEKIEGMTNDNNIYGFNKNTTESRMITNFEWAAIEYLTYSKYGNKNENCTGGTTGTHYGIYEMANRNYELVAANVNNNNVVVFKKSDTYSSTNKDFFGDGLTSGFVLQDASAFILRGDKEDINCDLTKAQAWQNEQESKLNEQESKLTDVSTRAVLTSFGS